MCKKYLLYVAYGEDLLFYNGIKISILSLYKNTPKSELPTIIVISEKPEKFTNFPVINLKITQQQINDWVIHSYHYRIKNRALAYVIAYLNLNDDDKILMLDSDTYFTQNINKIFSKITSDQCVMFLNENPITHKHYHVYITAYYNKTILLNDNTIYTLKKSARMWGSLLVGIKGRHKQYINEADHLMLGLLNIARIRTVEQFSLAEILSSKVKLVEGKKYIKHYSHQGRKKNAKKIISGFLILNKNLLFNDLLQKYNHLKIQRNFFSFIKEKLL